MFTISKERSEKLRQAQVEIIVADATRKFVLKANETVQKKYLFEINRYIRAAKIMRNCYIGCCIALVVIIAVKNGILLSGLVAILLGIGVGAALHQFRIVFLSLDGIKDKILQGYGPPEEDTLH